MQLFGVKHHFTLGRYTNAAIFCVYNSLAIGKRASHSGEPLDFVIKLILISFGYLDVLYPCLYQSPYGADYVGIILIVYSYFTSHTVWGATCMPWVAMKGSSVIWCKTNNCSFLPYVNMAFLAAVAGIVFAAGSIQLHHSLPIL